MVLTKKVYNVIIFICLQKGGIKMKDLYDTHILCVIRNMSIPKKDVKKFEKWLSKELNAEFNLTSKEIA